MYKLMRKGSINVGSRRVAKGETISEKEFKALNKIRQAYFDKVEEPKKTQEPDNTDSENTDPVDGDSENTDPVDGDSKNTDTESTDSTNGDSKNTGSGAAKKSTSKAKNK